MSLRTLSLPEMVRCGPHMLGTSLRKRVVYERETEAVGVSRS